MIDNLLQSLIGTSKTGREILIKKVANGYTVEVPLTNFPNVPYQYPGPRINQTEEPVLEHPIDTETKQQNLYIFEDMIGVLKFLQDNFIDE